MEPIVYFFAVAAAVIVLVLVLSFVRGRSSGFHEAPATVRSVEAGAEPRHVKAATLAQMGADSAQVAAAHALAANENSLLGDQHAAAAADHAVAAARLQKMAAAKLAVDHDPAEASRLAHAGAQQAAVAAAHASHGADVSVLPADDHEAAADAAGTSAVLATAAAQHAHAHAAETGREAADGKAAARRRQLSAMICASTGRAGSDPALCTVAIDHCMADAQLVGAQSRGRIGRAQHLGLTADAVQSCTMAATGYIDPARLGHQVGSQMRAALKRTPGHAILATAIDPGFGAWAGKAVHKTVDEIRG